MQMFIKTGDSRNIYQRELNKAFLKHDMGYENFKGLTRKTASDKYCVKKHVVLLKITNYNRYQRGIASMLYKFLDKKTADETATLEKKKNLPLRMKIS